MRVVDWLVDNVMAHIAAENNKEKIKQRGNGERHWAVTTFVSAWYFGCQESKQREMKEWRKHYRLPF